MELVIDIPSRHLQSEIKETPTFLVYNVSERYTDVYVSSALWRESDVERARGSKSQRVSGAMKSLGCDKLPAGIEARIVLVLQLQVLALSQSRSIVNIVLLGLTFILPAGWVVRAVGAGGGGTRAPPRFNGDGILPARIAPTPIIHLIPSLFKLAHTLETPPRDEHEEAATGSTCPP